MNLAAFVLGLLSVLPLRLSTLIAQGSLLLYLITHPSVRRELTANCIALLGSCPKVFWIRQAIRLGNNLALMAGRRQRFVQKLLDRTDVIGDNILAQILHRKRPIVVLTLHYGLWELLPDIFARRGYSLCVAVGHQREFSVGRRLSRLRFRPGVIWTDSLAAMRRALRCQRLVGFVLDNTRRTRGVPCSALGLGFTLLRTPFILQRTDNAELVPMFMFRNGNRFRVEVSGPVSSSEEFGSVARHLIQRSPEDWVFWGKRLMTKWGEV